MLMHLKNMFEPYNMEISYDSLSYINALQDFMVLLLLFFFFIFSFLGKIRLTAFSLVPKNQFSYFSTKTYVVGTQKNRLIETVLLSNQNISSNLWVRKYLHFYTQKLCLSKPVRLDIVCVFSASR